MEKQYYYVVEILAKEFPYWSKNIFYSNSLEETEKFYEKVVNLSTIDFSNQLKGLTTDIFTIQIKKIKFTKDPIIALNQLSNEEVIKSQVKYKYPHLMKFRNKVKQGKLHYKKSIITFFLEGYYNDFYKNSNLKVNILPNKLEIQFTDNEEIYEVEGIRGLKLNINKQ